MNKRTMKAVMITQYGGPEVLTVKRDINIPKIEKNQVLIENYAAGLNPHDIYLRKGILASVIDDHLPIIPGLDIAGKIVATGESVTKFSVGQNVYAMMDSNNEFAKTGFAKTGAYAAYCTTREDTLSLMPNNLSYVEAATIPLVYLTAYQAIVKKLNAEKGQKILINGASGGVGCAAVQIAHYIGLEVSAVCSMHANNFMRSLNPTKIIHYEHADFTKSSEKYDIIFDVVGNKNYEVCRNNLTATGTYISNVPTNETFAVYHNPSDSEKYGFHKKNKYNWVTPSGNDLSKITSIINQGHIVPIINKVFNIDEVAKAHKHMETGISKGKNVLKIKD
ncbi:NADP-dependent oxidoreductase [uncultured Croceitalea sp.]|uniref:NADP-dependent oxidoreductase n=1 Tax=uncultured Croceitalea sp. TaxID=1798908 RepID=UPI0033058EE6